MKQLIILASLIMSACAPPVVTNVIQLTPANQTALQDGTPIVRLAGHAGNPRATVSFIFANGDTLSGDAIINQNIQNSMGIWGQQPQTLSSTSTVAMVAVDDRQMMNCSGILSPSATNMTCNLSDGAVYRDYYIAPPPLPPASRQNRCLAPGHSGQPRAR